MAGLRLSPWRLRLVFWWSLGIGLLVAFFMSSVWLGWLPETLHFPIMGGLFLILTGFALVLNVRSRDWWFRNRSAQDRGQRAARRKAIKDAPPES